MKKTALIFAAVVASLLFVKWWRSRTVNEQAVNLAAQDRMNALASRRTTAQIASRWDYVGSGDEVSQNERVSVPVNPLLGDVFDFIGPIGTGGIKPDRSISLN